MAGNFTKRLQFDVKAGLAVLIPQHRQVGRYYEVKIISPGNVAQVGWADLAFRPELSDSWGVGDDRHSWAFDGSFRTCLWHESNCGHYGDRWSAGK